MFSLVIIHVIISLTHVLILLMFVLWIFIYILLLTNLFALLSLQKISRRESSLQVRFIVAFRILV